MHFVLGVNLQALGQSVAARYGPGIDSENYLRKFISLQLALPNKIGNIHNKQHVSIVYLEKLIKEMEVPDHLAVLLKNHLRLVARQNDVSIRDVGKIVSTVNLINTVVKEKSNWLEGWLEVLVTLIVAKTIRPDLYSSFRDSRITSDQLLGYLGVGLQDVSQKRGDEYNRSIDRDAAISYWSWMYLTGSNDIESEGENFRNAIASRFDRWSERGEASDIPQKVDRDWIDVFSFYGED